MVVKRWWLSWWLKGVVVMVVVVVRAMVLVRLMFKPLKYCGVKYIYIQSFSGGEKIVFLSVFIA